MDQPLAMRAVKDMAIKLHKAPFIKQTSEFKTALIDGDIIAFSVAAAADGHYYAVINPETNELLVRERYKKDINQFFKDNPTVNKEWLIDDYEPEEKSTVLHSVKQMITAILGDIGASDFKIYLTGKDNFRYKVNPEYKAHRKEMRKPYHLQAAREYLVDVWGAMIVDGMEADDALGIAQDKQVTATIKTTVTASIDKDLHCFPGHHYTWAHHGKEAKLQFINESEARLNFYRQVLTGDTTDNIIGLKGIGPAKAKAITDSAKSTSEADLYNQVLWAYVELEGNLCDDLAGAIKAASARVLFVAQQIWIMQEEGVMWQAPIST